MVMHNAAFAAAGIDGRYELMEIDEADVPRPFVAAGRGDGWLGLRRDRAVQAARRVAGRRGRAGRAGDRRGQQRRAHGRRPADRLQHGRARLSRRRRAGHGLAAARARRSSSRAPAASRARSSMRCQQAGVASLVVGNRTLPQVDRRQSRRSRLDRHDFLAAVRDADLAVNATTVGMIEPGMTIPVEELPATRRSSTASTSRLKRHCSPPPALAA